MNTIISRVALPMVAVIFIGVSTADYYGAKMNQAVTYEHPAMETPCRDPAPEKELRIWIDKRTSETQGVRTCRVVPINGEESPRKAIKKVKS